MIKTYGCNRRFALTALIGHSLILAAHAQTGGYVETDLVVNKQVGSVPTLVDKNGTVHIAKFFDAVSGGFFDAEPAADGKSLGVLSTRRKPLQDSPTPAGNPMAAIALLRLHHYTGDNGYRNKAEQTLEAFAGIAEQFGIFAGTYGIAVVHLLESPLQVVVVADSKSEDKANALAVVATAAFTFNKTVLRLTTNQATAVNLPPTLAATIPNLPQLTSHESFAVLCSGFSCQPAITDPAELRRALDSALKVPTQDRQYKKRG